MTVKHQMDYKIFKVIFGIYGLLCIAKDSAISKLTQIVNQVKTNEPK